MSTTARRPRKQRPPRHRHFRSFWALLYREAAYTLLHSHYGFPPVAPTRRQLWRMPKRELYGLIARMVRAYPARSFLR